MQKNTDLCKELSSNFIEYAYEVNSDRAIPDAKSGLKPVARRIIWDMYDNKIINSKPHVKCARVVGSVMGSWHPHGDSSIYGALVRLSQPWVMRYPLIDFHGSNGNQAGDEAASMRYTECRLSKISEAGLLEGLKKNNVPMMLNYDDTREEPKTLPAIFPNLLCNPNTGIGVAMAASWACHNLNEVAQAIFNYIDGKEVSLPGPDFPTGGLIINKNDIPNIMKTGHGSVKIRGKYNIEKNKIIFYELPYGISTESLLNEINEICEQKEIEGISEIRDESNKNGLRLVIICERDVNIDGIIKKLFAKTNLQTSFSYNQVALIDKTPTELNLIDCIKIYIEHNIDVLIKETKFDITKAEERREIVEGLLKALASIDDIITTIKQSESATAAKTHIIEKYGFSELQAKSILAMRLSSLAKLEGIELEKELQELINNLQEWKRLINSRELQIAEIKARLTKLVSIYGDDRRTELAQIELQKEEKEIQEVIPEDVVVILTQSGDIKRIPKNSFKIQKRNGKGVKNEGDAILDSISTNTIDNLMIFTSAGKMYKMVVDNIPVGTNVSKGVRINSLINMEANEKVIAATSLYRNTDAKYVVFITKNGLLKKTKLEEYTSIKKTTGIAAIKLKENDSLANVTFINEEEMIIVTKKGMSIRFSTSDIAPIGRVTMGVKSIKLDGDDEVVVGLPIHKETDLLAVFTSKGYGKKCKLDDFPYQTRGGKGLILYKIDESIGNLIGATMIDDDDSIALIGKPNSICISSKDIPLLSRTGIGSIMIKNSIIESAVKL